jgi:transcriptional regulator with XRE-family HTH domain
MPAMSRTDWARLGRAIRERRETLRISQGAAGVSASTWRKVEKAVDPPYRRSTLLGIAQALRWQPESIDRILAGGEPVEYVTETAEEQVTALLAELAAARARLGVNAAGDVEIDLTNPHERAVWENLPTLPSDLRQELVVRLRELRSRRPAERRAG